MADHGLTPLDISPPRDDTGRVRNAFTVDLEDWFCVRNLRDVIAADAWPRCESRVEHATLRILDLLDTHGVRGTFFTLGWVAQHHPDLVAEVARRGHEIACHSHLHRMVSELDQSTFRDDLSRALDVLGPLSPSPITGYRAPSFSVTGDEPWFWEELAAQGITYDSSVFPFGGHPDYGIADAPLGPCRAPCGIVELPMAVATIAGRRVPTGGGGYFRLLPYGATRRLMQRVNDAGRAVPFYLHPWEIDPGQPRIDIGSRTKQIRHYAGLARSMERLEHLLDDFAFGPAQDVLRLSDDQHSDASVA